MTASIPEGRMCGSWDESLARHRQAVHEFPVGMREGLLSTIAVKEDLLLAGWAESPPTPEDVDEACRELDGMMPEKLDGITGSGVPMTFDQVFLDTWVIVSELLEIKNRVHALESECPSAVVNPSFDDCGCGWGRAAWEASLQTDPTEWPIDHGRSIHSTLLDLGGDRQLEAIAEILNQMTDFYVPIEPGFRTLIAQHNWRDPVAMAVLASELDHLRRFVGRG